jgi:cell division protein FtsL
MKYVFIYVFALTIPLMLGLAAWQSQRYVEIEKEIIRLEEAQREWIDSNKRLIAGISVLSSAERIEHIAREELGLLKKTPEEVLQIRIEGEGRGGR